MPTIFVVQTQDDHVLPLDSHLPTSASIHHDTHILEQDDDTHGTPEDVHYDPLVFIRSPTSITKMNILRSPPPAFVSPTLSSSSSSLADTEETAESSTLFGVPHYRRTTLTYTSPDEEEEMADYLRFSLNIPRDGAPPVEGWWSGEGSPAWRPSTRELDSWAFPYLDLDDSDPFLDRNPAPGPLPPFILHTIDMSSLFASDDEDVEDSDGEEENLKDLSTLGIPPRSPVQSIDSDDDEDNDHSLRFPVDDRSDPCVNALIPFSSPHLSTSSVEDADDEPTHAFGVSLHDRLPEWHMDPEEDELREYLRFALGVGWQRDNAPPIEGWWSPANSEEDEEYDDANYAWYPFCMDMDSWNFPARRTWTIRSWIRSQWARGRDVGACSTERFGFFTLSLDVYPSRPVSSLRYILIYTPLTTVPSNASQRELQTGTPHSWLG